MDKVNLNNQESFQVGIVLATYNPELNLLEQQLKSIQQQDYPNWRCLVVDDASSPELQSAIASLIQADQRFILHCQKQNLGSYHNFEYGLNYFQSHRSCTHIAFSDQDDIWYPYKLSRLLQAIETQHAVLAHSDLEIIDTLGRTIHASGWQYEGRFPEKLDTQLLLLRNTVTGCTALIRRSLLPEILPFPRQNQRGDWYHDHWIALVASHKGKLAHIREPLVRYRQHGSNAVGAQKHAGSIRIELALWLAKKGRLTLKSYRIHRDLSKAFYQRFYPTVNQNKLNPFSEGRFDFGYGILCLGVRSYLTGYGSQGITLRLMINKVIFDIGKLKKYILDKFLPIHR
jgi:glycosyltransferase involved in cell wall biosynthesis